MNMYRLSFAAVAMALTMAQAIAQSPAPDTDTAPSFSVAAIKPHDPDSGRTGMGLDRNPIAIRNQSLASLIMFTYAVNPHQIVGAPDWADKSYFDIDARIDTPGQFNLQQDQAMLAKLLADRFQLKFHREKRELPVYAIRIAKGGPKLTPAKPDEQLNQTGSGNDIEHNVTFTNAAMSNVVLGMQFLLNRPIVDQTGLTGRYDFTLRYTADEANTHDPNAPPGIFTAAQEQLGLKFEPTKALVDVLVIDRAEMPSPN
jgi:uncharacterized protein (TIGR03435 family)